MDPELFRDAMDDTMSISANDNGDGEMIIIGIEENVSDNGFPESMVIAISAQQATAFAHHLLQLVAGL